MSFSVAEDLTTLGREAAREITGDAFQMLEVKLGGDSFGDPAYFFSFLVKDRPPEQTAVLRVQLRQRLRDDLIARGNDYAPIIRLFEQADWDRRKIA